MAERSHRTVRVISVVAATLVSLSCGTNYVYSAWAPQFAHRLKLSSTQSNLIGTSANLGMYAAGIPMGILVDSRGPRLPTILGAVLLGIGYYPMHKAYDDGVGSMSVPLLCFFSLLSGIGSCSAFSASLKTCALNWPNHRGTATAFPLAAFGLSAFFWSAIASFAFPENTSDFLLLLAAGTFLTVFVSLFFLRVVPNSTAYSALPRSNGRRSSHSLHRTRSGESRRSGDLSQEPGRSSNDSKPQTRHRQSAEVDAKDLPHAQSLHGVDPPESGETSSLMSRSSSSGPGDIPPCEEDNHSDLGHSHHLDIRGLSLVPKVEFWQLFLLLGVLSGTGLMTINNIGNDTQALWKHYDDSVTPGFIQARQLVHVSILSLASFTGRLLSGVGSDLIVKKLHQSRFWCSVAASSIFLLAQIFAIRVENPHNLWTVSSLTGLGYGILYGVYPSMVAEAFGVHGFSQNWGCMTLAPIICGNVFNVLYGTVYDRHSHIAGEGERVCDEGLLCYRASYYGTVVASAAGVVISLWSIQTEKRRKMMLGRRKGEDMAREA